MNIYIYNSCEKKRKKINKLSFPNFSRYRNLILIYFIYIYFDFLFIF